MDEVDNIIIDSLNNIECSLEDVTSLKEFSADMIVLSISSCLEAITQDIKLPKRLPPSMSAKLKVASDLVEHVRNLGFRGDLGFHSILYCNENEVRNVLMFLIERLPRDSHQNVPITQTGYVPTIVRAIEKNLKDSLKQMWIPSCVLNKGLREYEGGYLQHSLGDSCPLESVSLTIPNSKTESDALKTYWVHNVLDVTRQCSPRKLIPSLLFNDLEFPSNFSLKSDQKQNETVDEFQQNLDLRLTHTIARKSPEHVSTIDHESPEHETSTLLEKLSSQLNDVNLRYVTLKNTLKQTNAQLLEVQKKKNEEEELLKETLSKVKLRTKTLAVVDNEEKMTKLRNLVQNSSDRLAELKRQWDETHAPLLEEYNSLRTTLSAEESMLQEEQNRLHHLKKLKAKLKEDLKHKSVLEQALSQKCQQLNRTNTRSAYTKRILEIIGNIRKQDSDIQKILKETREVQRDINNLTGQVERSFTLSEEMIFYDAKNDETARKAYKLLAILRDECNAILNAVTDLGLIERESRNLQEQIEAEKAKDVGAKLEKVLSDMADIQKETQMLMRQSQL